MTSASSPRGSGRHRRRPARGVPCGRGPPVLVQLVVADVVQGLDHRRGRRGGPARFRCSCRGSPKAGCAPSVRPVVHRVHDDLPGERARSRLAEPVTGSPARRCRRRGSHRRARHWLGPRGQHGRDQLDHQVARGRDRRRVAAYGHDQRDHPDRSPHPAPRCRRPRRSSTGRRVLMPWRVRSPSGWRSSCRRLQYLGETPRTGPASKPAEVSLDSSRWGLMASGSFARRPRRPTSARGCRWRRRCAG